MSDDMPIADIPTVAAGYTFRRGDPVRMRMRPNGSLRAETWRDRLASALSDVFWPSPTFVVTAIDRERGVITVGHK